ncbi:STAS domain-containing protein [Streptomyces sp. NBC_00102]|uniref:STAS domain-containing protein n=1 Tax=Streptomyces sp. NBC_00102 TaxID=2975652 RepID=UPI00225BB951|nr:STAS domain-containing protein [Streptomyces sp. NBC_00102]MCX5401282.1 STAS domain-containing protein [Streptomyces sp. NBC_00102]
MTWDEGATLRVARAPDVFVIEVTGAVDQAERDLLAAAWLEAAEAGLPATVVDLSGVTFGDSGLLNELLVAERGHRLRGRAFIIAGPLRPQVRRLFTVTGTLDHFVVVGTAGDAPEHRTG